ncbi:MAG: acyl-CoA dehydrogenase [Chloroflexi bacterium]|nr:acyl-CoA dehydrogenase family protein [Ardenticatenaceae bacterium]MBL1127790.1 acyl-CoA dehydrogenase [Chloroflexota bacterium]NOG33858.1 acyl-CoA dehydrogenase [Chloroflexota bacterium]GIK54811.1 MAG: acyl-CoA dehydrogenase FadE20 [Chloroflexota bacterium]
MKRTLFDDEHLMFREAVRRFVEKEVRPYHEQWEQDGIVPRDLWLKAGAAGFLAMAAPEAYGGLGLADFRYNVVLAEELTRAGASGVGFGLHNDIVLPYILTYGTEEQKQRWLPKMISGETITAIAMSEPNAGSDLAGIQTTAMRHPDHYLLNGQKTFITNGINSDLVIVVAKTDPSAGHSGVSLLVVERGMAGFGHGRNLDKIGLKAQDTAELFFHNVKVPLNNLLGGEGQGFYQLMFQLPQERLSIAVIAVAACETVLEMTIKYCQEREAFGRPIGKFQHNRFKLAEMKTEIEIARVFVDRCITELNAGSLTAAEAAMAKWWTTELQKRVVDDCLQLHGGYGYMMEYPIAKAFLDTRVQTIYGGTTEIMKEIIGRAIGF